MYQWIDCHLNCWFCIYFQYTDSLYVVINLKNAVVKLTYGDDNGKFSLCGKSLNYGSKCRYTLVWHIFCAQW